ncbi:hypothetical protein L484_027516 [Morus notabilis]|uniref:Uncharacterized protein n=1 Tax=Morus notabilis TaxID=981085 RepID=W9RY51_9ROSA|nr:hypothetical protein L484_027516 [Morus notabilis]
MCSATSLGEELSEVNGLAFRQADGLQSSSERSQRSHASSSCDRSVDSHRNATVQGEVISGLLP